MRRWSPVALYQALHREHTPCRRPCRHLCRSAGRRHRWLLLSARSNSPRTRGWCQRTPNFACPLAAGISEATAVVVARADARGGPW